MTALSDAAPAPPSPGAWERLAAAGGAPRKALGVYETPPALARWLACAAADAARDALGLPGLEGALVLDPAAGSGELLLAARAHGARAAGLEIAAEACRLARRRLGPASPVLRRDALALDPRAARALLRRLGLGPGAPLVVLGNPPWSASRGARTGGFSFADQLLAAYVVPDRKKGVLRDLYVRFLALAEYLVRDLAGSGLLALVLNHSFLEGPVHRGLRAALARSFDRVWTLDLGGNVRRGQQGPLFDAQTGAALLLAARRPGPGVRAATVLTTSAPDAPAAEKLAWLEAHSLSRLLWHAPAPGAPWVARARDPVWESWPSLPELLPAHSEGVQTNRDGLAVAMTREELLAQVARWLEGGPGPGPSAHWSPQAARARLRAEGVRPERARPYLYRPFDVRWIYAHPALVHRLRPALRALWDGETPALAAVRQARGGAWSHVAAAHLPADNCLLSTRPSSRAKLFPLTGSAGPTALRILGRAASAREVGLWALAVLSAPAWQAAATTQARADWPRLPLPRDEGTFADGVALGEELLALWRAPAPPLAPGAPVAAPLAIADVLRVGDHAPLGAFAAARAGRELWESERAALQSAASALARMAALRPELNRLFAEVKGVTM